MRAHLGDRDRDTTDERRRHEAFLRELTEHWVPETPRERRLERLSRLVHVWTRWFDGPVGLRGVGIAALMAAAGSAVLTLWPPTDPGLDSLVPLWIDVGLTVGVLWFAVECLLVRGAVPRLRFAGATLVLAVFTSLTAALGRITAPADVVLAVAFAVQTVGSLVGAAGTLTGRRSWLHRGLDLAGVGAWGVALADGYWAFVYLRGGDLPSTLGCALAMVGTIVMANGLMAARPGIAPRRRPRPGPGLRARS